MALFLQLLTNLTIENEFCVVVNNKYTTHLKGEHLSQGYLKRLLCPVRKSASNLTWQFLLSNSVQYVK